MMRTPEAAPVMEIPPDPPEGFGPRCVTREEASVDLDIAATRDLHAGA